MKEDDAFARLRRFLIAILIFGMSGSAAELILLRHFEDWKQVIPLALIGLSVGVLIWHALAAGHASVRAVQSMMVLFIVAGCVGVCLHFQANLEFQREIDPSLEGVELLMAVLRAKAPPALAPGVMIQLGLLGLAFTYRHPALQVADPRTTSKEIELK